MSRAGWGFTATLLTLEQQKPRAALLGTEPAVRAKLRDDKAAHGGVLPAAAEPQCCIPSGTAKDIHCPPHACPSSCSRGSEPWRHHPRELSRHSQSSPGASSCCPPRSKDFCRPEKLLLSPGSCPAAASGTLLAVMQTPCGPIRVGLEGELPTLAKVMEGAGNEPTPGAVLGATSLLTCPQPCQALTLAAQDHSDLKCGAGSPAVGDGEVLPWVG